MSRFACVSICVFFTFIGLCGEPSDIRVIDLGPSESVRLWTVQDESGSKQFYQVIKDGVASAVQQSKNEIRLRYDTFDPLARAPRSVDGRFEHRPENQLYLVQFHTKSLATYRKQLEKMGVTVHKFLPNATHIARMGDAMVNRVRALPYVRWVGPYEPAYRLEEYLLDNADEAGEYYPLQKYNIMIFESDLGIKKQVAAKIAKLGGQIDRDHAGKYLIEATLTPEQLFEVVHLNEIQFIDRWSPVEKDMNISREITGANYVETVAGYTGQGVRGEVIDLGFNLTHVDFGSNPLIEHTAVNVDSHGAACSGIVFGDGTGNPDARGLLPDGQGIVADWDVVSVGTPRYDHTGELVQPPYEAVFQTASVGSARTLNYTTISADTDSALFDFDIVHCQSQSNAGDQMSRPQAWAKNIISGGAVNHYDTLTKSDDCWCSGASIGPATDMRIKPDLCHFYDATLTTTSGGTTAYTASFGGTSGATPNIAGNTGIFFQMWSEGIFGNDATPGASVFDNRPHMTTAKAAMINTAEQYAFSGAAHDLTRVHQGWGMPSLQNLYDKRNNMFFVDESDVLSNGQSTVYPISVAPGEPELKVTMVYADPPGSPAAAQHRINDLTLKVTDPSATEYWGNVGLLENNYSTPGGSANDYDTVENVFIQNPASGNWTVEVFADEINEDGHVETGADDADFALVVSGGVFFGFRLLPDTLAAAVCSPSDAVFMIDIDAPAGFVEPVTLSVSGLPAGASAAFTMNPVTPPGQTQLTISGVGSLAVGQYGFGVTGTSTSLTQQRSMLIDVFDQTPNVPALMLPADNATEVALYPTLEWGSATQAASYTVELATDMAFSNMVASTTTSSTSWDVPVKLDSLTDYYWRVMAGNVCGDSAFSTAFTFETLDQPLYFTEQLTSFDLDNRTTAFEPNGTGNFYAMCGWPETVFPTDPAGGTVLSLGDDTFEAVALTMPFNFYGTDYSTIYVGSNGYVTFNSGDTTYNETLADHFNQPRISGLFDDLSPNQAGTISVRQLADRVAVTYEGVTGFQAANSNNFQIEMFQDGRVHITHLQMDENDGIVGLSAGGGMPADFVADDLSAAPMSCEAAIPCPWDANGSGTIDMLDVTLILAEWHVPGSDKDVNGDLIVNIIDALETMDNFGACP